MTAKQRLESRMNELSHVAKKALGQNFLVSDHVIQKIIDATNSVKPNRIVEIGPGLGALTDLLKEQFGQYTLIELDKGLAEYWRLQGFKLIEGDALQINWSEIEFDVLVSNLPYQISSSIVIDRSLDQNQCQAMILMFQKEVAQRIRALAKTEEYGLLTVIAQEFWQIETVTDAGPRDFNPAPKVASRVLKFIKKDSQIVNKTDYLKFIKMCFKQRRRILKSNLDHVYHESFLNWITEKKLSEKVRAEELSPEMLKQLYFYVKGEK